MPFLTAISDFISMDWRKENHHSLSEKSALKLDKHLSSQQELMLLINTAQYGKYEEAAKFYNSLLNFRQAPYANIVCAQIMLAMEDSSEKKLLSDALNLSISFLNAAIEEFNQAPENEQQSWPYLITLAEIKMRKNEINSAVTTLEYLLSNKNLFPNQMGKSYAFSAILLLAKTVLKKFVNLKNSQSAEKDEILDAKNKLGMLLEKLKTMQLNAERKEILPALAALECEFMILSAENKIVHLSMIHANVALEMHEIYKRDTTFHLRDYLLDDTTRHRMEGIFQLTYAMESLFQKQKEIEQNFENSKQKEKRLEIEIHDELKNINDILNKNLAGLLNENDEAIKNFINALDLSNFQGGPLITLHFKNIFKNIFLALVLLGVGYLAPVTA